MSDNAQTRLSGCSSGEVIASLNDKDFIANASPSILLIAGTSGTGKSTLANHVINKYSDRFTKLIRSTTRPHREDDDKDEQHRFLSEDEFNCFKDRGDIYFQSDRFGYQYGFLAVSIKQALCSKKIFVIEGWKSAALMYQFWPSARIFRVAVVPLDPGDRIPRGGERGEILNFLQNRILSRNPTMPKGQLIERTQKTLDEIIEIRRIADIVLVNAPGTDLNSLCGRLDAYIENHVLSVV